MKVPYEQALIDQMDLIVSIKQFPAKDLCSHSGVDIERIYRIRKGTSGDLTWPEGQAIKAAMRTIAKNMARHA